MTTTAFANVTPERRAAAVAGFVAVNPHQDGITFDDMVDTILAHDAHLAIVGDIPIDDHAANWIVDHLANLPLGGPVDPTRYLPALINDDAPCAPWPPAVIDAITTDDDR